MGFGNLRSVEEHHDAKRYSEPQTSKDADVILGFLVGLRDHRLQGHGQNTTPSESRCDRLESNWCGRHQDVSHHGGHHAQQDNDRPDPKDP